MSLKKYLILMGLLTAVCWILWVVVIFNINPFEAEFLGLLLFYISLFLALLGTLSLIGFFLRTLFSKQELVFKHLGGSLRQAFFFSTLIVGTLLLKGTKLYSWWAIILLILGITILEIFFLIKKTPAKYDRTKIKKL